MVGAIELVNMLFVLMFLCTVPLFFYSLLEGKRPHNADMAGDIDGRRSTSVMLVFFRSAPISWLSLKQKVVVLSTCEAEYVAAATASCQTVWLRRLLGELTGVKAHPPALMVATSPPSPS